MVFGRFNSSTSLPNLFALNSLGGLSVVGEMVATILERWINPMDLPAIILEMRSDD